MKKRTLLAILFTIAAGTSLFAQGEGQNALLNRAYRYNSDSLLCQFFENWAEELPSNEAAVTNDTIKAAYEVFDAFFYAMLAEELADSNAASRYQDQPYFVVQGTLYKVRIAQTIPYTSQEIDAFFEEQIRRDIPGNQWKKELSWLRSDDRNYHPRYDERAWPPYLRVPTTLADSVLDFRPLVSFSGKRVLYLTTVYHEMLGTFVGNNVDGDARPISKEAQERAQRAHFLSRMIPVEEYYRNRYWLFITGPYVNQIILDAHLQRAVIIYTGYHAGYETIMEKINGKWVILSTRDTWIE